MRFIRNAQRDITTQWTEIILLFNVKNYLKFYNLSMHYAFSNRNDTEY